MNRLYYILESSIKFGGPVPSSDSFPLSYVPEHCGECEDESDVIPEKINLKDNELVKIPDGKYKYKRFGYTIKINDIPYTTTTGIRCMERNCAVGTVEVKNGKLTLLHPNKHKNADKIPGGKADNSIPSDFNQKELAMGIEVEKEHTDNEDLAREIAMDHLKEIPDYYTRLKKMEKEAGID